MNRSKSAGEAFVAEDNLACADEVMVAFQQGLGCFSFADLRVRQAPDNGHAFRRADGVEPEPPEEAGVGDAVAVAGLTGELRAIDGLP